MINAFSTLSVTLSLNYHKIKKTRVKREDFPSHQRVSKNFEKTMSQLLLMSYFYHKIMNKKRLYANQNIILSEKITWLC